MPCIADKDAAQTSTEHECRAQTRRPATDDDNVEDLRVGRRARLWCDHNSDLKRSATAEDENQDKRARYGNNQGPDAPEAVGEECEHYPLIGAAPAVGFHTVGEERSDARNIALGRAKVANPCSHPLNVPSSHAAMRRYLFVMFASLIMLRKLSACVLRTF